MVLLHRMHTDIPGYDGMEQKDECPLYTNSISVC